MNAYDRLIKTLIMGASMGLFIAAFLSGGMFLFMSDISLNGLYAWLLIVFGLIGVIATALVANHLKLWSFSWYRQNSRLFGISVGMVFAVIHVVLLGVWSAVLFFDIHEYFGVEQMVLIYVASAVTILAMVYTLIMKAKSINTLDK